MLVDYIMVFSLLSAKSYGAFAMFVALSVGSTAIFALSWKYGEGGFTRFDLACIALGLSGIVGWKVFGTPMASIVSSIIGAYAGTLPTFMKALKDPMSEDLLTWTTFAIGGFFNCLAIREWSYAQALTPIAVFVLQMGLVLCIYLPRKLSKVRVRSKW